MQGNVREMHVIFQYSMIFLSEGLLGLYWFPPEKEASLGLKGKV